MLLNWTYFKSLRQLHVCFIQYETLVKAATKKNRDNFGGVFPWRCFTKTQAIKCSCASRTDIYVLARTECLGGGDPVDIHAGASYEDNADQIVRASFLNASGTPEGMVVLKLEKKLSFNDRVSVALCKFIVRLHQFCTIMWIYPAFSFLNRSRAWRCSQQRSSTHEMGY